MLRQIKHTAAQGKIVQAICGADHQFLLLTFTDGTFSYFKAHAAYDGGDPSIADEPFKYAECDIDDDALISAGLLSGEEIARWHARIDQEAKAREDSRERAEYARLKAKFEGT